MLRRSSRVGASLVRAATPQCSSLLCASSPAALPRSSFSSQGVAERARHSKRHSTDASSHADTLKEVPLGAYMDAPEDSAQKVSELPPPPASPAAKGWRKQGVSADTATAPTSDAPAATVSWQQQQTAARVPAYFRGGALSDAEQGYPQDPNASRVSNGSSFTGGNGGRAFSTAATMHRVRPVSFASISRRHFSSVGSLNIPPANTGAVLTGGPQLSQTITHSTDKNTILETAANPMSNLGSPAAAGAVADFAPKAHLDYTFTTPELPSEFKAHAAATPTVEPIRTESVQIKVNIATEQPTEPSQSTSGASDASNFSTQQTAEPFADHDRPNRQQRDRNPFANLPPFNTSQLPQMFAMFQQILPSPRDLEKLAKQLPNLLASPDMLRGLSNLFPQLSPSSLNSLAKLAQSAFPVPSAIASVLAPLAGGMGGGMGGGRNLSSSNDSSYNSSCGRDSRKKTKQQIMDEMLRVDHAGEYGATRIYEGQLAMMDLQERLTGQRSKHRDTIEKMREHELKHLRNMERILPEHRVRPTALLPVWDMLGYALGAGSAMFGERAAMAATVAVEDAIVSHYNDHIRTLNSAGFEEHKDLKDTLKKHRDDEQHHKDVGIAADAKSVPGFDILNGGIQAACSAAIYLTKKV